MGTLRFLATAEHKDGGLDASDGGMAFALATGDLDGNFAKLQDFLGSDWRKPNPEIRKISLILDSKDKIASSQQVAWAVDDLEESLKNNTACVWLHHSPSWCSRCFVHWPGF